MVRSRKREIFENFADAADLMLTCVEAGLGLDAALTKVADEMRLESVTLAEELHLTNLEMRAGATREQSLRNLAVRTGVDEVGTFASMLIQADRFGTSIGESLRVFSTELAPQAADPGRGARGQGADQDAVPAGAVHLPGHHHGGAGPGDHPDRADRPSGDQRRPGDVHACHSRTAQQQEMQRRPGGMRVESTLAGRRSPSN